MKTNFKNVFNCLFIIILFSSLILSGCSDSSGGGGGDESSKTTDDKPSTWYADKDGDGFGNPKVTTESATKPAGHVEDKSDCNDDNPLTYPEAEEILDNEDNDCDGKIDENVVRVWYFDKDGDGFGNLDNSKKAIEAPAGYVDNDFDCNDNQSTIHPQAREVVGDGIDNNCNGQENESLQKGIIPDTGKTTPSSPEITGEDATYLIDPPSYTKLGDTGIELSKNHDSWIMVRDNVTGLIWEVKEKNSLNKEKNLKNPHDADNTYSWADANNTFIKALNEEKFGHLPNPSGENEWRLPTLAELFYLLDNSKDKPTLNEFFFPSATNESIWSSTQSVNKNNHAWTLSDIYALSWEKDISTPFKVRAVWGKKAPAAFADNKFGTIKDLNTGLMWQQATGKNGSTKTFSWLGAIKYCEDLKLAGYDDWRLPNKNELMSLVNFQKTGPTIYSDLFPDTEASDYWTSTNAIASTGWAYRTDFKTGLNSFDGKWNHKYVRAVRGGNHQTKRKWYKDADGDTYGDENIVLLLTIGERPPAGFVENDDDCNDGSDGSKGTEFIYPSATETPDDKIDQDCNGYDLVTWYKDEDGDNFADEDNSIKADIKPIDGAYIDKESAAGRFDCDDSNDAINPDADDALDDGIDNDCDKKENITWYRDADTDGYGSATAATETGEDQPEGYVANKQDCADDKGWVHPGLVEIYGDEEDSNCNGDNDDKDQQIIPDTGQVTSYTSLDGEDSDFLINEPGYTRLYKPGVDPDEADSPWFAVQDKVTGLIWEVKTEENKNKTYSFEAAKTYCDNLDLDTYTEWRLPTPRELSYLVHHDRMTGPAIDTVFFINTQRARYWTFSPSTADSETRLTIGFNYGLSYIENSPQAKYRVRAVHGEIKPAARFIDNYNDTILDTKTGLMWQKVTIPNETSMPGKEGLTWKEALTYCDQTLELADYTDWRLPNKNELLSLLDDSKENPLIDQKAFPGTGSLYWSSTSCAKPDTPDSAWQVNFSNSGPRVIIGGYSNTALVRAVRGGKIENK